MVCHEMMKAGQSVGAVSAEEMREFEKNCLVEKPAMQRCRAIRSRQEVLVETTVRGGLRPGSAVTTV